MNETVLESINKLSRLRSKTQNPNRYNKNFNAIRSLSESIISLKIRLESLQSIDKDLFLSMNPVSVAKNAELQPYFLSNLQAFFQHVHVVISNLIKVLQLSDDEYKIINRVNQQGITKFIKELKDANIPVLSSEVFEYLLYSIEYRNKLIEHPNDNHVFDYIFIVIGENRNNIIYILSTRDIEERERIRNGFEYQNALGQTKMFKLPNITYTTPDYIKVYESTLNLVNEIIKFIT